MVERLKSFNGGFNTGDLEEAYRTGLVDFEKDIKIDFERDNPVYFVDHLGREVDINTLSPGEKEYLYFYAYLRRIRDDEGKIILIDEPELHLHGNQVRKLCELITNLATNNQVIIATHSSDVLHHFIKDANIILVKKGKLSNPKLTGELKIAIEELGIPIDPSFFTAHWVCAENKSYKTLVGGNSAPTTQEVLKWIFGDNRGLRFWSFGGSRVNIESSIELINEASLAESNVVISILLDGDKNILPNVGVPPLTTLANKNVFFFPYWELENVFLKPDLLDKVMQGGDKIKGNDIVWQLIVENKENLFKSYAKTTIKNLVKTVWKDKYFTEDAFEDLDEWKQKVSGMDVKVDDLRNDFDKIIDSRIWQWLPGKEVIKIVCEKYPDFWQNVRSVSKEEGFNDLLITTELGDLVKEVVTKST
jgi:energy-coupling factor transporter ATP-binding protein EcfA2